MDQFLPARVDQFFRRHPRLLLVAVVALTVVVVPVLLFLSQPPAVLYQTF